MRWLSSFAILVYLSLLCSPQALAVHDSRVSPLADTQLQALNPSLQHYTLTISADFDDTPPVALLTAPDTIFPQAGTVQLILVAGQISTTMFRAHQPRAPPATSSH